MKHYRVIIHDQAIADIERNANWWAARHSKEQAFKWYQAAFDALYGLATFPESHSLAAENEAFSYEIRNLLFGMGSRKSFRAVFTIKDDKDDTVHILTIQRSSQDTLDQSELTDINEKPELSRRSETVKPADFAAAHNCS